MLCIHDRQGSVTFSANNLQLSFLSVCLDKMYLLMFGQNSPQQQIQAYDLSLVREGARLTAAQHGCLQGDINVALRQNNTSA